MVNRSMGGLLVEGVRTRHRFHLRLTSRSPSLPRREDRPGGDRVGGGFRWRGWVYSGPARCTDAENLQIHTE